MPYDTCMRCGKAVPWGRSVCGACNPGRLPEPSRTQFHATVFGAVFAVVIALALLGIWVH